MESSRLHVVTCIANPVRWDSRLRLFREFAEHMLDSGVNLTVVECAYGERPHELVDVPFVNHVPVRASARALVWNKEPLINLGIARLPESAKYVGVIDADVTFRNPRWAVETVHALQQYHVVQPWSDAYDLGPMGEHLELHRSLARLWVDGQPIVQGPNASGNYRFGHPGFAWAFTREALDTVGGLVETAGLGAADHHMGLALLGRVDDSIPRNIGEGYKRPLKLWEKRAAKLERALGYVPGTIEHSFHGAKALRAYVSRWDILIKNAFDPATDLVRNSYGVVELAPGKIELRRQIERYFTSRNEDANCIQ